MWDLGLAHFAVPLTCGRRGVTTSLPGPCDARPALAMDTAGDRPAQRSPTCCRLRTLSTSNQPRAHPESESGESGNRKRGPGAERRVRAVDLFPRFSRPSQPLSRPSPLGIAPPTGVRGDRARKGTSAKAGKGLWKPRNVASPKLPAPLSNSSPTRNSPLDPQPRTFPRYAPRLTPASGLSPFTASPSSRREPPAVPRGCGGRGR